MKSPVASADVQNGSARTRRRCYAPASSGGAAVGQATRRPSWISAGSLGRPDAVAIAKSPTGVASRGGRASCSHLVRIDQSIDSNGGRASARGVVPGPPSNKAIQAPGPGCHVACLRTRRANPDPAPDRRR